MAKGWSGTIGVAAALLITGALLASSLQAQSEPQVVARRPADVEGVPLAGGARTSLTEAIEVFDVPLLRPDSALASDASITDVWLRAEGSPQIYIRYDSGIVLMLRPSSEGLGTEAYAKAQIHDGVPGRITDVDGVAAFEVPQTPYSDLGSIRFVMDDVIVTIVGVGDFSADTLREIARSIVFSANQQRETA